MGAWQGRTATHSCVIAPPTLTCSRVYPMCNSSKAIKRGMMQTHIRETWGQGSNQILLPIVPGPDPTHAGTHPQAAQQEGMAHESQWQLPKWWQATVGGHRGHQGKSLMWDGVLSKGHSPISEETATPLQAHAAWPLGLPHSPGHPRLGCVPTEPARIHSRATSTTPGHLCPHDPLPWEPGWPHTATWKDQEGHLLVYRKAAKPTPCRQWWRYQDRTRG